MLISPVELADQLARRRPVTLLDVRWRLAGPPARADYDRGHIPGAVFVDLDLDLAGPPGGPTGGGRHPMPDEDRFGETMRTYGVRSDRPVVCYDDRDGASAARCWWLLTYFGHAAVSVLDGGLAAWVAGGGALTARSEGGGAAGGTGSSAAGTEPVGGAEPVAGDFRPRAGHLRLLDAAGAADVARRGVLLDARAAERYRGESEPIDPVAGHIPRAVSAPTAGNLDPEGRFLPAAELQRRFRSLGVSGDEPVGVYCGSGVTAAHEVLALKRAGVDAALYVGSWSDWISDPARPVETG